MMWKFSFVAGVAAASFRRDAYSQNIDSAQTPRAPISANDVNKFVQSIAAVASTVKGLQTAVKGQDRDLTEIKKSYLTPAALTGYEFVNSTELKLVADRVTDLETALAVLQTAPTEIATALAPEDAISMS